jgi:hypothetical protein
MIVTVSSLFIVFNYNYRIQNFGEAKFPINFSNELNNNLLLEFTDQKQLFELRSELKKKGFLSSTPLINLSAPMYTYFLNANVPNFSHALYVNRSGSKDLLAYNILKKDSNFNYHGAWILKFSKVNQSDFIYMQIKDSLQIIHKVSKLKFPDDYTLVYYDLYVELWKPNA